MTHVPDISNNVQVHGEGKRVGSAFLTRRCVFRVIRVSGTMRKAEEEAVRRAKREVFRLRGVDEVGVLGGLVGLDGQGSLGSDDVRGEEEEDDSDESD